MLIVLTWTIPPVFGLSFLLFINMFTLDQMRVVVTTPLEPGFIVVSLILAIWFFNRYIGPVKSYLRFRSNIGVSESIRCIKRFPFYYWGVFLFYLLIAPSSVILSAESYTDFVSTPIDWFRIHLVALIVSIIVGLPIFFRVFDLFGIALQGVRFNSPMITIKTKVFLIGSLVPLLVDTMLVQYYWTRTNYFSAETFLVWFFLQMLAIAGSLMFMRSFGQSLSPLQNVVSGSAVSLDTIPSLDACSTDELGVLAGHYQSLLKQLYYHGQALSIGKQILSSGGDSTVDGLVYDQVVTICRDALNADIVFLMMYIPETNELSGVSQTGTNYDPNGHFRISCDEPSLAILVFTERKLVAIDDVLNDPRVSARIVKRFNIKSAIAAPLIIKDQVIGALLATNTHSIYHYTTYDRNIIDVLAREAASLVHTQRLYQQRLNAELNFQQAYELAKVTLQSIGDGVITTGLNGSVEFLNPVAEQLTGWSSIEATGHALPEILKLVDETSGKPMLDLVDRCLSSNSGYALGNHMLLVDRYQTKEFAIEVRVSPIREPNGEFRGVVLVFHDITELRALTHRLSYQARHDALTGLVNRFEFESRIEQVLINSRENGKEHALCYIDLDQFKIVNDTCGHIAGDELLKQLATRMRASIRESDTIGRLGGDEFGLLLIGCHLDKANKIADKLLSMIKNFRFVWQDKIFDVGMSIGLVPITPTSGKISDILSAADSACYIAKDSGRNRIHVFTHNDLVLAQHKGEIQWLQRIKLAIENDQFELYMQPIKSVKSNNNEDHCEILLRLVDESGQIIGPNSFLPAAERYHLMPQVDRWVVNKAFSCLIKHLSISESICYSINLSGQSLCDDHFLDYVNSMFVLHQVPPHAVCFEITETTAIANLSHAMDLISELKKKGCRFSLDDFGSGLSSFAYLKNLPIDYLKIDGCFVKDIATNPIDKAMVESINQIGHLMGIQTVAEFVSSKNILQELQKIGVDYVQGFYLSKPYPIAAELYKTGAQRYSEEIDLS